MWDKIKRIAGQAFREFWPASGIALCWMYSRFSFSDPDYVVHAIANFSASFFFASWITGHIVRISRQQKQDDAFGSVEDTVKEAFEGVGQKVKRLSRNNQAYGRYCQKGTGKPKLGSGRARPCRRNFGCRETGSCSQYLIGGSWQAYTGGYELVSTVAASCTIRSRPH